MLDDEKLVELLLRRDDLLEQAHDATPEAVCEDCPELVDEFKARLESLKSTDWLFDTDDGEQNSLTAHPTVTVAASPQLPDSSLTSEQFLRAVTESGLMTAEEVEAFQQSVSTELSSETQSLAGELVQRKKLTLYQASVLLSERSDPLLLDRYIILDTIDSGGMGLVFKALHRSMDRVVALKTLPPSALDSEDKVKRFQREVKTAAMLSHPNIVITHDAHQSNGIHFLVMEYVKGKDLGKVVKAQGPLPVATAVDYLLQAARGLEHAHAQGIVHRDVKPANLLLDADGTVKVLDLGLARLEASNGGMTTEEELTTAGGVMGTAAYMSPEQAANTHDADARSDVYSLGCTFHYLLTGEPPYKENTLVNTILAHRDKPIPALSEGRDDVAEDVIAVYRRMMAKKPEDRFQSMTEVIGALSECEVAEKEPVAAAEVSVERGTTDDGETVDGKPSAKVSKRSWTVAAVGMLFVAAAIVLGVVFKLRTPDGTLIVEINEPHALVQVLDDKGKVEITRKGEKGKLSISVDPGKHRLKVEKEGFQFFTTDFAIESGGEKVITARLDPVAEHGIISSSPTEVESLEPVRTWSGEKKIPVFAFSPDGSLLVVAQYGRGVQLLHTSTLEVQREFSWSFDEGVFSLDGSLLFLARNYNMAIDFLEVATGDVQRQVNTGYRTRSLALSPDGSMLLSAKSADATVSLWDVNTGELLRTLTPDSRLHDVAFSLDGTLLVCGTDNGAELWGVADGKLQTVLISQAATGIALSPDGSMLATADRFRKNGVTIWDLRSGEVRQRLKRSSDANIAAVAFSADGSVLATGCNGGMVTLWSLATGAESITFRAHSGGISKLQFSPGGRWIATSGGEKTAKIWDVSKFLPSKSTSCPLAIAPFTPAQAKQHQQQWADHLKVPVEFSNSIGMKMVLIPPAEFMMGSSEEEIEALLKEGEEEGWLDEESTTNIRSEGPQHRVRITMPFRLAAHEVTVGHFKAFVEATGYKTDAETRGTGWGCFRVSGEWKWELGPKYSWRNTGYEQTDQHPVVNVTRNDAVAFCEWLSQTERKRYRLPTEAQWEYACRSGSTARWCFGNNEAELEQYAWYLVPPTSPPVGGKLPNTFGLHDMHGNVGEWCLDVASEDYYKSSPENDPEGPSKGIKYVLRGGTYLDDRWEIRSSQRRGFPADLPRLYLGFRPALVIDPTDPKPTPQPPAEE